MKQYNFLNESSTGYGSLTLGGSTLGWAIARKYTDTLRNIVLNSNTPNDAIQSILSNQNIENEFIKEEYSNYIQKFSNDPNWKVYTLEKIERRKIYGMLIGAVSGAGLRYGIGKLFDV